MMELTRFCGQALLTRRRRGHVHEHEGEAKARSTGRKGSGTRYTAEFRREALRLIDAGKSQTDVAEELGVTVGSLQRWRLKADARTGKGAPAGAAGESVTLENDRLKRELRAAKMELEIAKKAAAFVCHERAG